MEGENEFPIWSLLPKKETGVSSFLNKFPNYDGRGIVIGIFDSGIDPGAEGFQVTSDGKQKVIARYDCSGAGDVNTSTVVKPDADGFITGLSGRKIKIPTVWNNPSGEYRIGLKNAYDLYQKALRERVEKEKKEKLWDPAFAVALADSTKQLTAHKTALESLKEIPLTDKLKKEELESRVEVLNSLEKKKLDLGPAYDCILFNDGSVWRVCIDTSEKGDLTNCPLIGEYEKTYEMCLLIKDDYLNISINVYEDGNILEIVSLSSSHGTHVAAITAANFPDQPEKNGIAPGAQLVSFTIADSRLDTMETGTAIVRAMIKVMESQKTDKPVSVINMSYGEQTFWSSTGRLGTLMNEVVDKYGVCWVSAGGNNGPALCTVGTPPNISTNNIIGVGAYVSPEMMTSQYSLRFKAPGQNYTWTSRGPTIDGGKGICVCAPGGAITSVPQNTLRSAQLLHGTSMASPHVAGAIAILLSGLKAKNLPWSPYLVRRALENTASIQSNCDIFAQGCGLLQVEKAFDYLVSHCEKSDRKVRFQINCGGSKQKGIHLRGGPQDKPRDVPVLIEPVFADNSNIDSREKINFHMGISLACDVPWVTHPSIVNMTNITRTIEVRVDPTGLPEGVHQTSIRGYDSSCIEKGPVLRIEVTVVKPHVFVEPSKPVLKFRSVEIKPGQIFRLFTLVPDQASYAVIRLRVLDHDKNGSFVVHAVQLKPKQKYKALEYYKLMNVNSNTEVSSQFQVKGGLVLELVIAKFWMEQNVNLIDYSVQFCGCRLDGESFMMHHSEGIISLEVLGGLQVEEINPSVQLKYNVISVKPSESKISVLDKRDIIPPARHIYQLELTYNFHIFKTTDVTPISALLSDYLYESEFESQIWMLFDSNKMAVAYGDAFPSMYTTKLEKGDYVLKQQIRHDKKELLEKVQDLPLLVSQKLHSPISLDIYSSHAQAILGGKKISLATVPAGKYRLPIYIAPIQNEKHLKNVSVGQYLSGTIALSKGEHSKKVDSYKFRYVLSELSKKSSNNSQKPQEKTKWEEYQDALRDLKTTWLAKIENGTEAEKLYKELKGEFPDHLGSHTSMLASLEPDSKKYYPGDEKASSSEGLEQAREVLRLSSVICELIDQNQLLAHLGTKADPRPEATTIKTAMEKQKTALLDALIRKGSAACRLHMAEKTDSSSSCKEQSNSDACTTVGEIDEIWLTLLKFVDATDYKALGMFGLWHAAVHNHMGRLLRYGLKISEEKSSKELESCLVWAMNSLGWTGLASFISSSTHVRFPLSHRLF